MLIFLNETIVHNYVVPFEMFWLFTKPMSISRRGLNQSKVSSFHKLFFTPQCVLFQSNNTNIDRKIDRWIITYIHIYYRLVPGVASGILKKSNFEEKKNLFKKNGKFLAYGFPYKFLSIRSRRLARWSLHIYIHTIKYINI